MKIWTTFGHQNTHTNSRYAKDITDYNNLMYSVFWLLVAETLSPSDEFRMAAMIFIYTYREIFMGQSVCYTHNIKSDNIFYSVWNKWKKKVQILPITIVWFRWLKFLLFLYLDIKKIEENGGQNVKPNVNQEYKPSLNRRINFMFFLQFQSQHPISSQPFSRFFFLFSSFHFE